jgi:hypothetical protein
LAIGLAGADCTAVVAARFGTAGDEAAAVPCNAANSREPISGTAKSILQDMDGSLIGVMGEARLFTKRMPSARLLALQDTVQHDTARPRMALHSY